MDNGGRSDVVEGKRIGVVEDELTDLNGMVWHGITYMIWYTYLQLLFS